MNRNIGIPVTPPPAYGDSEIPNIPPPAYVRSHAWEKSPETGIFIPVIEDESPGQLSSSAQNENLTPWYSGPKRHRRTVNNAAYFTSILSRKIWTIGPLGLEF